MIFKCDWQAPFGKLLHTRYEIWFSFAGTFLINLLNENLLASGAGLEGEQMVWGVWLYLVRMNACKMSISVGNFNKNPSILFFHSFGKLFRIARFCRWFLCVFFFLCVPRLMSVLLILFFLNESCAIPVVKKLMRTSMGLRNEFLFGWNWWMGRKEWRHVLSG